MPRPEARRDPRGAARRGRRAGFSLIEVVVALSLIAVATGAMAPLALRSIAGNRVRVTQERMRVISQALVGDRARGDYGYLGEMGAMPADLAALNTQGAQPGYGIDAVYGIGSGWNGPYVPDATGAAFVDAWGRDFQYQAATGELRSAGPDRSFATGDDIVVPDPAPPLQAAVRVRVIGLRTDTTTEVLGNDQVKVYVAEAVAGVRTETRVWAPFLDGNVAPGLVGVRAEGKDRYDGSEVVDIAEVARGTRQVTLTLEETNP